MSEIADRYRRAADAFVDKAAQVPDDKWESPSPCEGWTARDVVRHTIDAQSMFLGFVDQKPDDIPSVDKDPVAAVRAVCDVVQANLDDPARAKAEYEGFSGKSTFEEGVDRFVCGDLTVHGWDLARATGLDERMDPDEIRRGLDGFGQVPDEMLRNPQVFGPALEPPAGADEQTRYLAWTGRRSW